MVNERVISIVEVDDNSGYRMRGFVGHRKG